MATQTPSIALILLALTPFLLYVQAQKAPAPAPQPLNLTGILDKAGQYSTLIRLLGSTQVGDQIVNEVNNSYQGLTLLAPTDNAFNNLKSGTLNGLSTEEQVALLLYHVLPRYYTLQMFDTISNPVRTEATGNGGGNYYLNFTSSANQVNVSTGVVQTQINNAVYTEFPLAIYQVDAVLQPLDLFGPKPNKTASPPPSSSPAKKSPPSSSASSSSGPSASENSTPNAGSRVMNVRWSFIGVIGFMIMGAIW